MRSNQPLNNNAYSSEIDSLKSVIGQARAGSSLSFRKPLDLLFRSRDAQKGLRRVIDAGVRNILSTVEVLEFDCQSEGRDSLVRHALSLIETVERLWVQYRELERDCAELEMVCPGQWGSAGGNEPGGMHNPYLREFKALESVREYCQAELDGDADAASRAYTDWNQARRKMTSRYSWAIPSAEALCAIRQYAPIIEGGAGTGYWGYLFQQMGVDYLSFDLNPVDVRGNGWHRQSAQSWCPVVEADENIIVRHRQRTLFLCCPPSSGQFGRQALELYAGEIFLYAGELDGCAANESLKSLLEKDWLLISQIALPRWPCAADSLYIFWRKSRQCLKTKDKLA